MSDDTPDLKSMREVLEQDPQCKEVKSIFLADALMRASGHYLSLEKAMTFWQKIKNSNEREDIKTKQEVNEKLQENLNKNPHSKELIIRNIAINQKDAPLGSYWLIPGKTESDFHLLYVNRDKEGNKVLMNCEGKIDPPNFKLMKSALRKTWYEFSSLEECVNALLVDKKILDAKAAPSSPSASDSPKLG